ncbi:MAG: hypothetical protein GC191_01445 [Azospirillum sp.]|nr:hypothetical protein [Azospirillum sp.]
MAGIGFALRKLARRDDLIGVLQGYAHAAVISSGPWLFTILSLGTLSILSQDLTALDELVRFRVIVIYNFAFSVVLTGPVVLVATRFLADAIYCRTVALAPGLLLAGLGLTYGITLATAVPFYLFATTLEPLEKAAAIIDFALVAGIWTVSIFLSALKDFVAITVAFAVGMVVALGGGVALAPWGTVGMLGGFSLGLALIKFGLIARILAEYPHQVTRLHALLASFGRFWDLALIGLVSQMAIWVDKWVMWSVPEREMVAGAMAVYPAYDSAMFVAYLTIVPALTIFTVNVETHFFENYQKFYKDIQGHANYDGIISNHRQIIRAVLDSIRRLIILQGAISASCIFLAPQIIGLFRLNYLQVGMFRFGVLGAFFHTLFLFATVLMAYFDLRRRNLFLQLVFLALNFGATSLFAALGFPWYGYGYFLASLVAFSVAYLVAADALARLPYLAFIGNNPSVH